MGCLFKIYLGAQTYERAKSLFQQQRFAIQNQDIFPFFSSFSSPTFIVIRAF
jgi:hypothetical protein